MRHLKRNSTLKSKHYKAIILFEPASESRRLAKLTNKQAQHQNSLYNHRFSFIWKTKKVPKKNEIIK